MKRFSAAKIHICAMNRSPSRWLSRAMAEVMWVTGPPNAGSTFLQHHHALQGATRTSGAGEEEKLRALGRLGESTRGSSTGGRMLQTLLAIGTWSFLRLRSHVSWLQACAAVSDAARARLSVLGVGFWPCSARSHAVACL
jgi:hypothetical protein